MSDKTPEGPQNEALKTPLYDLHLSLGARLVDFAGYSLPIHYTSIMAEHKATRTQAGLFDVSHMGQILVRGRDACAYLETLVPGDIAALAPGQMRYTQFTNDQAGILDDLIVTRFEDHYFLVVNGACKHDDLAHMRDQLSGDVEIEHLNDRGLFALQGPAAAAVMAEFIGPLEDQAFMSARQMQIDGTDAFVSRSGYTGEDGFEISLPPAAAAAFAEKLLAHELVSPIGLGARDSLRLEAGLCLYGHDLDPTTTPAEAGLMWSISKRRRSDGGFPGADVLARQLAEKPSRRRVGLKPLGRAPAREGAEVVDSAGTVVGKVTSGGFAPTLAAPIAMAYVGREHAEAGSRLGLVVRSKTLEAEVAKMPFVPQNYYRG